MAERVGIYASHETEAMPGTLLVDLGVDPTDEDLLSALKAAPPSAWLCSVPVGGTATFLPLRGMDLTNVRELRRIRQ